MTGSYYVWIHCEHIPSIADIHNCGSQLSRGNKSRRYTVASMAEKRDVSSSVSALRHPEKRRRLRIRSDAPCPKHEDGNDSTICWCGLDDSPDSEADVFGCYPRRKACGDPDQKCSALAGTTVERPSQKSSVTDKVDGRLPADSIVAIPDEFAFVKETVDRRSVLAATTSEVSTGESSESMVLVDKKVEKLQ